MLYKLLSSSPQKQGTLNLLLMGGLLLITLTALLKGNRQSDFVTSLNATATDNGSTFIMATGQIDEAVEGVFFLDRTVGTLQCWVLSKNNGRFVGKFGYMNVFQDIGAVGEKNPSILMTTGVYHSAGGAGPGARPANCVVYVLNESTGQFAVYGVPWNAMMHGKAAPAVGAIALMNTGMTRDPELFRPR